MKAIALEGIVELPQNDLIPPASEWNWTPDNVDLDEVIEKLSATKTPMTSRDTGYMSGQDFGEMY